jgi:coenzyme F420-reducing hydrogenase beta subunit
MIKIKDKKICCGCSACATACPKKCIRMIEDNDGFLYPKIDDNECINCNLCEKACPIINSEDSIQIKPLCYAMYNKDNDIRIDSSSGGIFNMIAKYILKNKGIVYGASFNKENNVEHIRVDDEKELPKLRKSKYVQSEINNCYENVKKDLEDCKMVYFTGTPCQVEGLLKYLRKDYTNLYTQDIICHGVPSKKVWQKYLKEKNVTEFDDINFRNKQNGWDDFSLKLRENCSASHRKDLFMRTFLSNCNIRPSCFHCKFKKINRLADITLGDFWGIKQECPEMYDQNGVSAVLIHSKKGEELFNKIKDDAFYKMVEYENVISNNSAYYSSVKANKNREKFFRDLDKYYMETLCEKYCRTSFRNRVIGKIKRKIKKFLFMKN